jgi:putative methionine-R-sulfoxide reductase with GAF domain
LVLLCNHEAKNIALGPVCWCRNGPYCNPFGKGICGQAAESKLFVVPDVAAQELYCLQFYSEVRNCGSLFVNNKHGQIDIDSCIDPFTEEDERF